MINTSLYFAKAPNCLTVKIVLDYDIERATSHDFLDLSSSYSHESSFRKSKRS